MLALPALLAKERRRYEGPELLLSDYARFDVQVDEVLAGRAPVRFSVTWDNSTFGEPLEMEAGPFLLAARNPSSKLPPLRGPSATILPNREPNTLTLLQAPCSDAFIFPIDDPQSESIRRILKGQDPDNVFYKNGTVLYDPSINKNDHFGLKKARKYDVVLWIIKLLLFMSATAITALIIIKLASIYRKRNR